MREAGGRLLPSIPLPDNGPEDAAGDAENFLLSPHQWQDTTVMIRIDIDIDRFIPTGVGNTPTV
jgi:hypothetical protein